MFGSPWEWLAVILGIGFLLLAVRENPWCWLSGGISVTIFMVLFWRADLYMQSLLQAYYIGMSVYGWWHWRHGHGDDERAPIVTFSAARHGALVALILALGIVSGWLIDQRTDSALPYLDALTTWGAAITTWMAARKVLENWLYWIVIDAAAIFLYLASGLHATVVLFVVYFVLAILGYLRWKKSYQSQSA